MLVESQQGRCVTQEARERLTSDGRQRKKSAVGSCLFVAGLAMLSSIVGCTGMTQPPPHVPASGAGICMRMRRRRVEMVAAPSLSH